MQRDLRNQAMNGAKALRSHAFLTLLAILTLCATPLGTGELLAAASSQHVERGGTDARHGDLPRRDAMPTAGAQTEFLEEIGRTAGLVTLADDTPDAIEVENPGFAHEPYREGPVLALTGVFAERVAGFSARAPPLN